MTMILIPDYFTDAVEAACAAHKAWRKVRRPAKDAPYAERRRMEAEVKAADIRHIEACHAAAEALGKANGWRLAAPFSLEQLRTGSRGRGNAHDQPVVDNEVYYREPGLIGKPAAILSHTYAGLTRVIAFANEHRLAMEVLPVRDWYCSEWCLPVLFTRPEHVAAVLNPEGARAHG